MKTGEGGKGSDAGQSAHVGLERGFQSLVLEHEHIARDTGRSAQVRRVQAFQLRQRSARRIQPLAVQAISEKRLQRLRIGILPGVERGKRFQVGAS